MTAIRQGIGSWDQWPDDVRERLHRWNWRGLLSFKHHSEPFVCQRCQREIEPHRMGDCVLRHRKSAHSRPYCEVCVVEIARQFEKPPHPDPLVAQLSRQRDKADGWVVKMQRRVERLQRQIRHDDIYIGLLEERLPAEKLQEAKALMSKVTVE